MWLLAKVSDCRKMHIHIHGTQLQPSYDTLLLDVHRA